MSMIAQAINDTVGLPLFVIAMLILAVLALGWVEGQESTGLKQAIGAEKTENEEEEA